MLVARRRNDLVHDVTLPYQFDVSANVTERSGKSKNSLFLGSVIHCVKSLRRRPFSTMLFLVIFAYWICLFTALIRYIIPRMEKPLEKYPYLRAKVYNPLRYIQVSFFDPRPSKIRSYVMTNTTAFFINLDKDEKRREAFLSRNQDVAAYTQRYRAHEWVKSRTLKPQSDSLERFELQNKWKGKYQYLQLSSNQGKFGDAACSLSHILLWGDMLITNNYEYIYVFEDDALVLEPLRSHHSIQAPDLADVVFLSSGAIKRVDVPWQGVNQNLPGSYAVRVIGGFGAYGYIITQKGAKKLLDCFQRSRDPIDLTFFSCTSLHVYLPISGEWPTVGHGGFTSTRLGLNH
jgi:hypothetical protein